MLLTSGEQGSGDNLFGDNPYISGCPHAKLELVALIAMAKFMLSSILKSVGNSIYFPAPCFSSKTVFWGAQESTRT